MDYTTLTDQEILDLIEQLQGTIADRQALAQVREHLLSEAQRRGLADALELFLLAFPEFVEVDTEEPVEPPQGKLDFAFLAHSPSARASYWSSISDRPWANGAFVYWPGPWGHSEVKWDQHWEAAVAAHPEGLHTVVSPKAINEAALIDFCERLPQSWRDKMVFAFYQEPEDNFLTDDAIADFRANVKRAGEIVRPYGIRNAVELQEWSLDPNNKTYPAGTANLSRFVDPADIDHISWSVYEKNLKDRSGTMFGRIRDFMTLFPSLTYDLSATGVSVPPGIPADDPRRITRANIVRNFLLLAAAEEKCTGFGWFDFEWTTTLDYRADSQLVAVFEELYPTLNS